MPEFRYSGAIPWNYPETKDAGDRWLGDVNPGDVRDLEKPPDDKWEPVGGDPGSKADPEPAAGKRRQDKADPKTAEG